MKASAKGVLLVSPASKSGVTVLTAGLAGAFAQAGCRVQAVKPFEIQFETDIAPNRDQAFLNQVGNQPAFVDTLKLDLLDSFSTIHWNKINETLGNLPYPMLLDCPLSLATPWQITSSAARDAIDLAEALNLKVVLVLRADADFLNQARLAMAFLASRLVYPIGLITVDTHSPTSGKAIPAETIAQNAMLLSRWVNIPILGHLPYSPSISVQAMQQGNLIRLTEECIDLLPLQLAMEMMVAS